MRGGLLLSAGLVLAVTACQPLPASTSTGTGTGADAGTAGDGDGRGWRLPSVPGAVDYQLGAAYEPPADVTIVVRDSTAFPAEGRYSICYVNAFQTQPADRGQWLRSHPHAVLTDADGRPVVDPAWPDELVLDTSTEAARATIDSVLAETVERCAAAGFDAIELDNLDTWLRIEGLTMAGNLALAEQLIARSHDAGLAVAQKNAVELGAHGPGAGFDFAISEECAALQECAGYRAQYGELHIDVEYVDAMPTGVTFPELCAQQDAPQLMVLRDLLLTAPDDPGYVFERCQP
ncbi:endo alpha-1,4 polygalactosaminidase [Agrococcus sp. Ld7]|uniref:endo alpha-1,4 polygalactosaminidase n=1 Tax=Agrococcus sp. Ld7 TaxID=649148 RepID=UPI0038643AD8